MNTPLEQAQLKQAQRNQAFTEAPMTSGQCALAAQEVALFPVRYAIDESPQEKGSNQGPNPLPEGWKHEHPDLHTRSYALRQLRDGWLYVWNSVDTTFHEYQVTGEQFTRHIWTDAQLNQDARHNPGEPRSYLLYPRRSQLRIAYSPVQWTWRMCEKMRSNISQQHQWMREVDLPAFCASGQVAHGGVISELGNSVADILVSGDPISGAPTFTSTLLPTLATEGNDTFKPAFDEALVRGRVPEQDTALFIALDDPLAIVDDLHMNLTGRRMEQSLFEMEHQDRLQTAMAVQNLCGLNADALIPESLTDPLQRQVYTEDLYTLLDAHDKADEIDHLAPLNDPGIVDLGRLETFPDARAAFKTKWGHEPDNRKWRKALEHWNKTSLWREDVRFDEVRQYLSQTTTQAIKLHGHCERSELDLLTWLGRLHPSAEEVFYDTCHVAQSTELLKKAQGLYTVLGNGEHGQSWLCQQPEQATSLFGTALFNFNPEIQTLIQKVTHNFSTFGTLDEDGREGDGSTPGLTLNSAADATNLGTRVNELKGVLDLQSVQNSRLYKAMSNAAQQAMSTLIRVANDEAKLYWHALSPLLLPAMKPQVIRTALVLSSLQVLVSVQISHTTQLVITPDYGRNFQRWLMQLETLSKQITGAKSVLHRPNPSYDQRAARNALRILQPQMDQLFLERPNLITARVQSSTQVQVELRKVQAWLYDFGHNEVSAQSKAMGKPEYMARTTAWMEQNLGNALPVLVLGLNLWNLSYTAKKAGNDGHFTPDEWRNLGASAAYVANAVTALWVGPAWNRAGGMATTLGSETKKVAQAGYAQWFAETKAAVPGSARAAVASEFAAVSKGLIFRTVTWATLGAVAAGLEAWQLSKDMKRATTKEELNLLGLKRNLVMLMATVPSVQALGTGLGWWFSFGWVMSGPVMIIIAILGIAYLIISVRASLSKREGLRLWLYRCTWGRGSIPEWQGKEGHIAQMRALHETLQRPSVAGRALYIGGAREPMQWQGFWLQILVPDSLAGREVTLQPAMVETNYLSKNELKTTRDGFYGQFLDGNWIDPKKLGVTPAITGGQSTRVDFNYTGTEQHRLWQVWINTSIAFPILELEIKYPDGGLVENSNRGYMFRLALVREANEADRANNAFNATMSEDDDMVLNNQKTQLLELAIPSRTKSEP